MARNQNIFNLIRGDKFDGPLVKLTITNDDGSPKDMTGTVVRSQLRDKVDGGDCTHDFGTIAVVVDTNAGTVEFTLTATGDETAGWPISQLYGDIEIKGSNDGPDSFGPYTFAKYVIKVEPDITQKEVI